MGRGVHAFAARSAVGHSSTAWAAGAASAAALAGLGSVAVALAAATDVGTVTRSVIAVAVLTAVGAGTVALAAPGLGVGPRLVLSAVLGLAVAGVAVWASGVVGWAPARWPVLALPVLAWFAPGARSGWRALRSPVEQLTRWAPALASLGLAWGLAARSLTGYYEPVTADVPWRSFYVDLPWHAALTAETLDRAPGVYPWIPDVPIGYSWLFFGTLGLLGRLTGAGAADMVLLVGPALLALLVPLVLVTAAWVLTRSRVACAVAPLLFELTRAPLYGHVEGLQLSPQWVLVNRDATNAMVLAVVVLLVLRLERRRPPSADAASLAVLGLLTFAVAATRGGAVAPLVGAAGLVWLVALLSRRRGLGAATWSLVTVVVAIVLATVGVTRSSGSFRVDPLSFLPVQVVGSDDVPVASLASVAVALAMTGASACLARWAPETRPAVPALVGAAFAGILGMALFGHPSFSQLYFFHAGWPALVVGMAAIVALAWRHSPAATVLVLLAVVVASSVLFSAPSWLPPSPWPARAALGTGVVAAAIALGVVLARRAGPRGLTLPFVAVGMLALQPWALPEVVHPAAVVQPSPTTATVSAGQLALLEELRDRSGPLDLVATNKHCLSGSLPTGDCDARWFTVAAFAERRVLVEGWSYDYTWSSSGTDNLEPYWDPALLAANDTFFADPTLAGCHRLVGHGVDWLYADHREAWSERLTAFAERVAETDDASVYRLNPDCR
jgi:hypothetical protein